MISDSGRRPPGQDAVSPFRIAVALDLSALGPAAGAVTGQAPGTPEQPWQVDAPVVEKTPVLDGILAPGEWDGAAGFELGYQIDPGDNSPPSERTEVFVMRTSEFLYVAFHAHDRDPAAVRARVARRDDLFEYDYVGLYLDTYNDRQRAYALFFNPLGVQADGIYSETAAGLASRRYEDSVDLSWDGIFDSQGSVVEDGYVVEAAIPFKTLRFASGEGQVWGLHVQRWIGRRAERDAWTPVRRDVSGLLVQMGSLRGLEDLFTGPTLDLIPTVTLSRSGERLEADGLHYMNRLDAGLTANWALAPHLVLSAAVNPDFSQVESDVPQIVVNQRFPLFYPEKRPFFLEGAEVFLPAQPSGAAIVMVDTRTIVDPDGGLKLSGKLGRVALGLLAASDAAPGLRVARDDPAYGHNAQFTIARLRCDVGEGSAVGFFVNDWRFAKASNTVLESDGRFRLTDSLTFAYQVGGTRSRAATPDQTTDSGFSLARLTYDGQHLKAILSDKIIGDGYRNEAGFIRRTGIHSDLGRLAYDFRPEDQTRLVALQPYAIGNYQRTSEGFIDESYFGEGLDALFPDGLSASFLTVVEREYFGGTRLVYRFTQAGVEVERFKRILFSTYVQVGGAVNYDPARPVVGDQLQISADVTVKPNDRLSSEFLYLKARLIDSGTGERFYDQDIYRNRTVFQFTRNTAARSILEYDSYLRRLSASLLYSYTPHPNTAVYVGYGEVGSNDYDPFTGNPTPGYFPLQRTAFVKLSYNYRLGTPLHHRQEARAERIGLPPGGSEAPASRKIPWKPDSAAAGRFYWQFPPAGTRGLVAEGAP